MAPTAIEVVRATEARYDGWSGFIKSWAQGKIPSDDFWAYIEAQKTIRREQEIINQKGGEMEVNM